MGRRVPVGLQNYWIEGGNLTIFTNPNTWGRTKIKTLSTFTTGTYTLRLFAPEMGVGDMASIGAFFTPDDTHELDLKVTEEKIRNELEAEPDDLIVYMTSQKIHSYLIKQNQKGNGTLFIKTDIKFKT
jgi:hypothetical protein